jgi:hypothetical protein
VRDLLDQESFTTTSRWRTDSLLPPAQALALLNDLKSRHSRLLLTAEELSLMKRSLFYAKALERMRVLVRLADFVWKSDQVRFFQYVSEFFTLYGNILMSVKHEKG